ncbi:sensor domain-containing protein [Streptomyces diastatochromogenes]|nr:sensor domain-containing protein [Streptomyces diastatochromogenes]
MTLLPLGIGFRCCPRPPGCCAGCPTGTGPARPAGPAAPQPARPAPRGTSACRGSAAILGDDGFWHDLRWAWLEPWTGGVLAAVPLALVEYGAFGALVQPFVWRRLGDGNWYAFVPVTSTAGMLTALLLGLVLITTGLRLAPVMATLHARLTHRLLSAPRTTELTRRVARLADTRPPPWTCTRPN